MGIIQSRKEQEQKLGLRNKPKKASCIAKSLDKESKKGEGQIKEIPKTKLERKHYYSKCKQILKRTWDSISETQSEEEGEGINVPSSFKTYTIQDRRIVTQSPKREKPTILGESYDGPEEVK